MIDIRPPETLLEPCTIPDAGHIETNAALVELLIETAAKLKQCAARIDAIREFYGGKYGNGTSD